MALASAPRTMSMLTVSLSLLIGALLGLLGGGGSILMVPLLVYVAQLAPRQAIATSLLIVGTTSVSAMVVHVRAGRVSWATGVMFGLSSMLGSFAGARLSHLLPSALLLGMFTAMMLLTGLAMLRRRDDETLPRTSRRRGAELLRVGAYGAAIGALTGLVGAGGGFLIAPVLALRFGLSMQRAVGTSLLVIALNALAGFGGHLGQVSIDWPLALSLSIAAAIGSLGGAIAAGRIPPALLRTTFGWLVVVMAVAVGFQQLMSAAGLPLQRLLTRPVTHLLALSLLVAAASIALRRRSLRRLAGLPR